MNCATDVQIEIFKSGWQLLYYFVQFCLLISTIILSVITVPHLIRKSMFPDSTRIMLFAALIFANLHELAFAHTTYSTTQRNFWPPNATCYELTTAADCLPVMTILASGISGNMLTQFSLCLDRILATIFTKKYNNLRFIPGVIFVSIVTIISFSTYRIIRQDIPLDDLVLWCSMFPSKIAHNANIFLQVTLIISLINFCLVIIILKWNSRLEKRQRFRVLERYQTVETLKATKSICIIVISQFISMLTYSCGVLTLRTNQARMSLFIYLNIIPWFYTHPYSCVSLPSLILFSVWFLRRQRTRQIHAIQHQNFTQDDHMKSLRSMWERIA